MEENKNTQKDLFNKSDKYFFKANLIFIIIATIYLAILLVTVLILMINENFVGGIISLATGALSIVVAFFVFKLILSMLADIKYIRNKLYNLEESENEKISDNVDRIGK